jgi:hypothetical protein
MDGVLCLGENYHRLGGSRLFAHQIGDAFLIVDEHTNSAVHRIIAIAIALMQNTLVKGNRVCKSAISAGGLADVQGCYPERVRDRSQGGRSVAMGEGLLTTFPVMGTSLIRSFKISKKAKGPLLIIDDGQIASTATAGYRLRKMDGYSLLDWIHSRSDLVDQCKDLLNISTLTDSLIERKMRDYINSNCLKEEWKENARKYLEL